MKKIIFSPEKNFNLRCYIDSKVFSPTRTTELIVKSIKNNKSKIKKNKKILDLGCGSGVIGISIKKKIFKKSKIFFSDLSENAVKLTQKNIILNKLKCDVKKSDLMQVWKNEKFDLIINDVSGISSFFLKKIFWYNKFIPCQSGLDGTKLTLKFFGSLKKRKGLVIIPLISLSNVSKVKNYLNKKKINFKTILKEDWPLPYSLINKHKKNLIKLKKKRLINYKEKYGNFLAYTEIILLKL